MFSDNTPDILKALNESETRMFARMDKDRGLAEVRSDKIETSIRSLEKDVLGLTSIVASNYQAALTHMESKKSEIKEEVADKYVTQPAMEREIKGLRKDLSQGLTSLRNTAKIVWAVVSTIAVSVVWLSKEGFL